MFACGSSHCLLTLPSSLGGFAIVGPPFLVAALFFCHSWQSSFSSCQGETHKLFQDKLDEAEARLGVAEDSRDLFRKRYQLGLAKEGKGSGIMTGSRSSLNVPIFPEIEG